MSFYRWRNGNTKSLNYCLEFAQLICGSTGISTWALAFSIHSLRHFLFVCLSFTFLVSIGIFQKLHKLLSHYDTLFRLKLFTMILLTLVREFSVRFPAILRKNLRRHFYICFFLPASKLWALKDSIYFLSRAEQLYTPYIFHLTPQGLSYLQSGESFSSICLTPHLSSLAFRIWSQGDSHCHPLLVPAHYTHTAWLGTKIATLKGILLPFPECSILLVFSIKI